MSNKTMTLQKANAILANKEDYSPKQIEEAQKFIDTNQSASVDMSIEKARAIKEHPEDYEQDKIDQASAVIANHRPAPGKWIGKYIPINKEGGFNFNWRQAYNKPIKDDEDVQKLDDWRNTQVWDVDDKIDLRDVAKYMGFKHPDESWEDFQKSDRFPIFQDFLKDVQKSQQDKELDKIWSGEEPSPQWTPFGYKEVPGSMFATNFTTPVAKEYARRNYNEIPTNDIFDFMTGGENGKGMAAPLTVDVLTNAAMLGSGKAAGMFNNPYVKDLVANITAPAISSVGGAIVNDKTAKDAVVGTVFGYGANKAAPKMITTAGRWLFGGQRQAEPSVKSVYGKARDALNDAVNQARKQADIEAKSIVKEGPQLYKDYNKNIAYTDDVAEKAIAKDEGFIVKDLKDMPTKASVVDRKELVENVYEPEISMRTNKDIFKKSNSKPDYKAEPRKPNTNAAGGDLDAKMKYDNFQEAVDKLRSGKATAKDWQDNYEAMESASKYLGLPTMESMGNWANAHIGILGDYLSNIPGSNPKASRRFMNSMLNLIPPDLYNLEKAKKKEKTEELKRIYGL